MTRLLGKLKNPIGRQKWPSNYGGQMSIIGRHVIDIIDGIQPLVLAIFISILQGICLVFCSFSRFEIISVTTFYLVRQVCLFIYMRKICLYISIYHIK